MPARSISLARPATVNGAPLSETKVKADFGLALQCPGARKFIPEQVGNLHLSRSAANSDVPIKQLSPNTLGQIDGECGRHVSHIHRVLLYGKAGGAWVGANNPNLTVGGFGQTLSSSTTNNFGWTAGVGVEWAFAGNWSARVEYDFIGLQNQTVTVAPSGFFGGDTININNRNISLLTAGMNYKFGGLWY